MLHLLCPLVVCGECLESGSSGLGVATSKLFPYQQGGEIFPYSTVPKGLLPTLTHSFNFDAYFPVCQKEESES